MSRDADEALPPRRPKSSARRPPRPNPGPTPFEAEGPSTFRPNPGAAAGKPTRPKPQGDPPERLPSGPTLTERILFGSVGTGQLAVFCRQFAAYLDAGVDILKALASLEKQYVRTALGPVISRVHQAVRGGENLATAMEREPKAFDTLFISMIKVAEARGGTPETLRMLSKHYEARQSLIRQARSALIYPIAVLVVASAVIAMLTLWLLPKFAELLKDIAGPNADLPLPSRVLLSFSAFVQSLGWWLVPLLMIGLPILLFQFYRTRVGKRLLDSLALWVPVFGKLLSKLETTRFARTLATLLESGVDVGTSLDLTADVMQLFPFRRAVQNAKGFVLEGGELSVGLDGTRRFAPDVIAIVESGEETGKLPESLEHLADDYEQQVEYMVRNMGQLVQPLLMIVMGGIVLFVILAVMLPYIAMINNLAR